ncbi:hypothetical protein [Prochlorococcus marinus]|uniref:Class I SAM-dependent methyltransferase n=1 Tax=Prochlorococcus marinus XMU1408 TaxID=2213228 RepID=A0A318R087_PROMR|nr:hypothetical protein [Prochlorococcus marinus]MBW3041828.1 hypothetical protein [Prochlorococcus marinus str. XMU1408]PYE02967.1 hypothetical protein DNJ73_04255 [Prochlorococcus marinus XMU1408]
MINILYSIIKFILLKIKNLFFFKLPRSFAINLWPTKSYEVWLLIQFILLLIKPRKIVEFGSGRSTHYLAEYTQKFNCKFYSIEENIFFIFRNLVGLKLSYLNQFNLIHVPTNDDWYSLNKLIKYNYLNEADFLFIDGPNGSTKYFKKRNDRNSSKALKYFSENYSNPLCIIIDDLQDQSVMNFSNRLLINKNNLFFILFKYSSNNLILFCVENNYNFPIKEFIKLSKMEDLYMCGSAKFDEIQNYIVMNDLIY